VVFGSDSTGTVTFTSDFLTFSNPGNSYTLLLSSVSPIGSQGAGAFLNSFTASVSGTFAANATAIAPTPEPGTSVLLATGWLAIGRLRRKASRRSRSLPVL
jgi:hypothetical protein